jgi:PRTRC genetic system protein B
MSTHVQVEVASVGATRPSKAILFYGSSFASVHDIENNALLAGRPLGTRALREALEALHGATLEWLPSSVLAYGGKRLVWFEAPQPRALFFETNDEALNALSGMIFPMPGLLFEAGERSLKVWAYRGEGRPARDEAICVAPFFNTSRGSVCLGSMRRPATFDASCGEAWSSSYFSAAFTHQTQPGSLSSHPGSPAELWLEAKSRGRFDPAWLIPTGQSLEAVIAGG